jgi:hypothetical protein
VNITERNPALTWEPPRRSRAGMLLGVFPDGVKEVRLTMRDGTVLRRPVRENAVLVSLPATLTSMGWSGSSGGPHVRSFADPDSHEQPAARGCPTLEPLPADADQRAAEAGLAARPRLYPGTTRAEVTRVRPLQDGDREPAVATTCGRRTAERTLVVELELHSRASDRSARSNGTVLVGQSKGRMIVWQQLR